MSSVTTLSRPYAKAAFELARADDALAEWDEMLSLASRMAGDEQISGLLDHPQVPTRKVAQAIADAAGERFSDRFRQYLSVLADNRRLALLVEITAMFHVLRLEAENRLKVRVVSATALDPDQADRMRAALARRFEKEIELDNEVDSTVLGGAVIYAGDQVIDGSLRGRIKKLAGGLTL